MLALGHTVHRPESSSEEVFRYRTFVLDSEDQIQVVAHSDDSLSIGHGSWSWEEECHDKVDEAEENDGLEFHRCLESSVACEMLVVTSSDYVSVMASLNSGLSTSYRQ